MRYLRAVHRAATAVIVLVTVYLCVTGLAVQVIDLRSIFQDAPASDPNVMAMRESFDGPPNFQVIRTRDYEAAALPRGADLGAMLSRVMTTARSTLGAAPLGFVELRMAQGRPVGQVSARGGLLRVDALTGASLGQSPAEHEDFSPASDRNTFKRLHRMTAFGDWALFINVVVGIGLGVLIVTGLIVYWKMMRARARNAGWKLFWASGGWWRTLHRAIALLASVFLIVVTLSGSWLAVESLGFGVWNATHHTTGPDGRVVPGTLGLEASSPIKDAALPGMLSVTLRALAAPDPGAPIKVMRLRWYAGMPQGVVVTGGPEVRQLVFDARTGRRTGLTEPGYPPTGFPFGWAAHELAKKVHRGDFIGLSGRFMDLFAGLSLLYLSVSGIVIYADLWRRRRKAGQGRLIWI